ncbi:MAG: hypothetical protein ACI90Y_001365, partial [Polaromonas sp.]
KFDHIAIERTKPPSYARHFKSNLERELQSEPQIEDQLGQFHGERDLAVPQFVGPIWVIMNPHGANVSRAS